MDERANTVAFLTRKDAQGTAAPVKIPLSAEFKARYELGRILGSGGMGMVVEAQDLVLRRLVAIKFLLSSDDEESLHRFLKEGQLLARIPHPGLVTIFDVGELSTHPYLVMEHMAGGTLHARIVAGERLPHAAAIRTLRPCLEALAVCHQASIIHRDIKPANILFSADGQAKLSDLGVARALDETMSVTRTGAVMGTLAYMAPEQFSGEPVGPPADIYAVGTTLYQMISGRLPFDANTAPDLMRRKATQAPTSLGALGVPVPVALSDLVQRLLARRPEDRPTSVSEVIHLLDQCQRSSRTSRRVSHGDARPITAQIPSGTGDSVRLPWLIALCAATFIAALLFRGKVQWSAPHPARPGSENSGQSVPPSSRSALLEIPGRRPFHSKVVMGAFSPNSLKLATFGRDGSIQIWEAATRTVTARLHAEGVHRFQWISDHELVAAGENKIMTIDLQDGKSTSLRLPKIEKLWPSRMAWVQAMGKVFCLDDKRAVFAWGSPDWEPTAVRILSGDRRPSVVSPDGFLASWSNAEHSIYIDDLRTQKQVGAWAIPPEVIYGTLETEDRFVGGSLANLTRSEATVPAFVEVRVGKRGKVALVSYGRDDFHLIHSKSTGPSPTTSRFYSEDDLFQTRRRRLNSPVGLFGAIGEDPVIEFSPEGDALAVARADLLFLHRLAGDVPLVQTSSITRSIIHLSFSPDGRRACVCLDDGRVCVFDRDTGGLLTPMPEEQSGIVGIDLSADGLILATCEGNGTIRLWDVNTRRSKGPLKARGQARPGYMHTVSRSPAVIFNQKRKLNCGAPFWLTRQNELLFVKEDATFTRMNPEADTSNPILPLRDHGFESVLGVSLDGELLILADSSKITIWDSLTGKPIRSLDGRSWAAVSPTRDPTYAVRLEYHKPVQLDIFSSARSVTTTTHPDWPQPHRTSSARFSRDGETFAYLDRTLRPFLVHPRSRQWRFFDKVPEPPSLVIPLAQDGVLIGTHTGMIYRGGGLDRAPVPIGAYPAAVTELVSTPSGDRCASLHADGTALVWSCRGNGSPSK